MEHSSSKVPSAEAASRITDFQVGCLGSGDDWGRGRESTELEAEGKSVYPKASPVITTWFMSDFKTKIALDLTGLRTVTLRNQKMQAFPQRDEGFAPFGSYG